STSESAARIREVLGGAAGACRDVVLANAAAALVVAGLAADWKTGVAHAAAAIDEGKAAKTLARLVECSNAV
ncbi:MAG TPA: anthranilate phosphoribosyltransferase, partial [Planctomycetia bacterium]|nr:anthranilate phosphoribosyltransferase [Planctomycetia bacterium]